MEIDRAFQPSWEIKVGRACAGHLIAQSSGAAAGGQVRPDLIAPIHAIRHIGVAGAIRRSRRQAVRIGKTWVAIGVRPEREGRLVVHTAGPDIRVGISSLVPRARIALPNIISATHD